MLTQITCGNRWHPLVFLTFARSPAKIALPRISRNFRAQSVPLSVEAKFGDVRTPSRYAPLAEPRGFS